MLDRASKPAEIPTPSIRLIGVDARYQVVSRIGEGGNSEVYRCFDQVDGRWLALKRQHPQRSRREQDRAAFLWEAEVMQQISHPTVPQVDQIYPERMTLSYFTLELVEGINLCEVIRGWIANDPSITRDYPVNRLMAIIRDVAEGLATAHDRGILHRDVKPENIMVCPSGPPKLIDWGIAVRLDRKPRAQEGTVPKATHPATRDSGVSAERDGGSAQAARRNQVLGTPRYMSPEQVTASSQLDHRSDLFSLAAVMYDCLALAPLVNGHDVPTIFHHTVNGPFQNAAIVTRRPSIPASFDRICMRAASIRPDDRHPNLRDFAHTISAAIESVESGIDDRSTQPTRAPLPIAVPPSATLTVRT